MGAIADSVAIALANVVVVVAGSIAADPWEEESSDLEVDDFESSAGVKVVGIPQIVVWNPLCFRFLASVPSYL